MATSSPETQNSHPTSLAIGFLERRRGISDLVLGQRILEHAVTYLVREQAQHAEDYQHAIVILCCNISKIAEVQQRAPARACKRKWLQRLASMQKIS